MLPCIIWFKHVICNVFSSWHHLYTSIRLHAPGTIMPSLPCIYRACRYTMHVKNHLMSILAFGWFWLDQRYFACFYHVCMHLPLTYPYPYITTIIIYRTQALSRICILSLMDFKFRHHILQTYVTFMHHCHAPCLMSMTFLIFTHAYFN